SAFGGAGQRCLAGSVVVAVGDAGTRLAPMLVAAAGRLRLGRGLDDGVQMGPVVSDDAIERVAGYVRRARTAGARVLLEPSETPRDGSFAAPVIFDGVRPGDELAREEIFGPVLAIVRAATLDEAISVANASRYGNAASIFTARGAAARSFAASIDVGMVGINVGVAAPMAFFPFGGVKESIFGDLRCHGKDAVAFYTQQRVIVSRWPDAG